MHELLQRKIAERKWGHVLFHGGVPGSKRKDLIDRFRDDPNCRIFLSTDAGGVGLNLQHASVVVNMDLPWNPAVLEQRIGRVHRLGQKRPVRVVNFVAQGTIEEQMLEVLKFKKSLFAGILDGGDRDVFMGGSRLNKFMEQVEAVTAGIPQDVLEDAEEVLRRPPQGGPAFEAPPRSGGRPRKGRRLPAPLPTSAPAAASDPLGGLVQAGVALLQQLTAAPAGGPRGSKATGDGLQSLVRRDERTGETFLRLPVPPTGVLEEALRAVGKLLESLRQ
jgi:hypothetical protein